MKLIKYIIFAIILLYLQVLFISKVDIFGARIYILLALVIYFSINLSYFASMTFTFILSLIWDVFNPELLGLNLIINVIICHLIFLFHQNINKDKFLSVFLSVIILNLAYFFGYWLYYIIIYQDFTILILNSVLSIILNSLVSVVVLYVLVLSDKLMITLDESKNQYD